jgi:Tol biopolymer transport system component
MQGIAIKDRETSGAAEMVFKGPGPAAWSPDGTSILLNRPSADGSTELSALNLSDRTMRTVLRGPGPLQGIQFSPDGKWMAYSSSESGRAEVYVTDYPAAQFERQVSTMAGRRPSGRGTDASSFM